LKSENSDQYQSGAVRALVALHEREMRNFLNTWNKAVELNVTLPPTEHAFNHWSCWIL